MKAFYVGLLLGTICSVARAGVLPASRGGTGQTSMTNFAVGKGFTLAAGTTLAAPMFIPSGSTLATPAAGAIESNGTRLYWTNSSGARFYFNFTAQ